jgi:purine-binding chemotaxis protein CheW
MKNFPNRNVSQKFSRINTCWEFKKCEQILCPVYLNESSTVCYYVSETLCDGGTPQSITAKIESCKKCDFYQYIEKRSLEFREKVRRRLKKLGSELQSLHEISPEEKADIFRKRAEYLSERLSRKELEEQVRMLTFCLGNEEYCVRIQHVLEVLNITDINKLPCTPHYFAGVINLRGNVLTLMDISQLLGVERSLDDPAKTIVVIEVDDEAAGIVVDKVEDILDVTVKQIVPPLTTLKGIKEEFTEGEVVIEGHPVTLLNLVKIMKDERMKVSEMIDSSV